MRGVRHGWLLRVAVAGLLAAGCSPKPAAPPPTADSGAPLFPATFRQSGFRQVRGCRAPGEHSGLNGFTVWVDDASAAAYDDILGADAGVHEMPAGAIVVKELYRDRACGAGGVDHWVAMGKSPGFDPAHGDWVWQELSAAGTPVGEGREASCYGCHAGGDDMTCIGYGAMHGMDYLCTAP